MKKEEMDNYGKPRQLYFDKISAMKDEELYQETRNMIWLSAFASNNPRSDYHWKADATYDEWQRRGKPEGYERAYKDEYRANFG